MISQYLNSFSEILNNAKITDSNEQELSHQEGLDLLYDKMAEIRDKRSTLFMIGNGGSSGIVSHASVDFINTCKINAYPITDSSLLTCMANDYGYDRVFEQPLSTILKEEDALLAISSSGKSPNILKAANMARDRDNFVVTYSGFNQENPLRAAGSLNFYLNANNYGKVEIGHALLIHIITDRLSGIS